MELWLEKTVVAVKDQLSCDLGDEAVILGIKTGAYFGLNETASFIWSRLQEPVRLSALRDQIVEAYEVDPHLCEKDLRELIEGLAARGLVEFLSEKNA
jgi:hypothetical protein